TCLFRTFSEGDKPPPYGWALCPAAGLAFSERFRREMNTARFAPSTRAPSVRLGQLNNNWFRRNGHRVKTMIVYTLFEVIVYTFYRSNRFPSILGSPWIK